MERIVELLEQIAISSEDVINHLQQELDSFEDSDEFLNELLTIILDDNKSLNVRLIAILQIKNRLKVNLALLQFLTFDTLIHIISVCPYEIKLQTQIIVSYAVNSYFREDCLVQVLESLTNLIFCESDQTLPVSVVLRELLKLKTGGSLIPQIGTKKDFCEALQPFFGYLLENCTTFPNTYTFHNIFYALSHITNHLLIPNIDQWIDIAFNILTQNKCSESPYVDKDSLYFLISIIEVHTEIIDDASVLQIVDAVRDHILNGQNNKVKAAGFRFLQRALSRPTILESLGAEGLSELFADLFVPQFIPTAEDLRLIETDPIQYICSDIETTYLGYDTPVAAASVAVSWVCQKHEEVIELIKELVLAGYSEAEQEGNSMKLYAFSLFAIASLSSAGNGSESILEAASSYFSGDSFCRCAFLAMLSVTPTSDEGALAAVLESLGDDSVLVRYFASLSLTTIVRVNELKGSDFEDPLSVISDVIGVSHLLPTDQMIFAVNKLSNAFSDALVPIAGEITSELLDLFEQCNSDEMHRASVTYSSFIETVKEIVRRISDQTAHQEVCESALQRILSIWEQTFFSGSSFIEMREDVLSLVHFFVSIIPEPCEEMAALPQLLNEADERLGCELINEIAGVFVELCRKIPGTIACGDSLEAFAGICTRSIDVLREPASAKMDVPNLPHLFQAMFLLIGGYEGPRALVPHFLGLLESADPTNVGDILAAIASVAPEQVLADDVNVRIILSMARPLAFLSIARLVVENQESMPPQAVEALPMLLGRARECVGEIKQSSAKVISDQMPYFMGYNEDESLFDRESLVAFFEALPPNY